jgi:WD40 repeat protein
MSKSPDILILALGIFLQVVPGIAQNQSHPLKFEKAIGTTSQGDELGWMNFVSFSPDGKIVAGGSTDDPGKLTLWSFPEGQFIKRLPVGPAAISPDWKYYATDQGVTEMETGKPLISLEKNAYAVHAFSPDSRYVAESIIHGQGRADSYKIRVVELGTGKRISTFGKYAPFSIAISPDGSTLAAGYWDVIILWNMLTGKTLGAMSGVGRYVGGLSFSPDGKLLAAGTDAGGLQLWEVSRLSRLQSLSIGGSDVSKPEFSPDGRLVAVGIYGTGTAWLIDVSSGKILDRQKVSDLGCGSVAFSPDGRYLITPSTGGLITWPYDVGGTIRVFKVAP